MLSALHNEEWFVPSYPFSPFGDMESEIAELRTLTKVTKLRQQIECRQEGAWMVVRDIPDEKSKSGTRKVTTYGHASKSVSRSFSQDISGQLMFDLANPTNVIIEHPPENPEEKQDSTNKSVEITEVTDEQCQKNAETTTTLPQIPVKKTSVVTFGKGNLVLINDEDSNFQVTGISKGRVADAVSTLERVAQEKNVKNFSEQEKKVKKVGFSKTEVHFAPDSGRVKIVETDEKPPPTQILRRKKRNRIKTAKSDLPKLYFGNSEEDNKDYSKFTPCRKGVFSVIREPSPLLTLSATANVTKKKDDKSDNYGYVKKVSISSTPNIEPKCGNKSNLSYLGNVSPKLSKLLQNSKDFQIKQKQDIKSEEHHEGGQPKQLIFKKSDPSEKVHHMNLKVAGDNEVNKPLKIVTQVCLGAGGGEVEHKFVMKGSHNKTEPIYVNREITVELTNRDNASKTVREKTPKPKPRTTLVISPQISDVKNTKLVKQPEKVIKRVISKPKEVPRKESPLLKPTIKQCSRSPSNKFEKKSVKCEINTINSKLQKLNKNVTVKQEKSSTEVKVRKTKEPLRSFEKVSNGWVGHCITPIKTSLESTPREAQITISSKIFSNKPTSSTVHSGRTQGRHLFVSYMKTYICV